ncbi:MAG: NAD-dependent epimerase/dehydratase family protein, partial [bacterium]
MRLLVTGAAGFIGSHIARHFAERHPDWEILTIERLNYAAALNRLADLRGRINVVLHDLRAPLTDQVVRWLGEVDWVIHAAAETHV